MFCNVLQHIVYRILYHESARLPQIYQWEHRQLFVDAVVLVQLLWFTGSLAEYRVKFISGPKPQQVFAEESSTGRVVPAGSGVVQLAVCIIKQPAEELVVVNR